MSTFSTILVYGIPASLLLSVVIAGMGLTNPRLLLRSYPKNVQAVVRPMSEREMRQTLSWVIPFWFLLGGFPAAAALAVKASNQDFLFIFLSAFGSIFLFHLVDWLILYTTMPTFVVLAGTEGMAGYKNYAMHFKGVLIGPVLPGIIGLIVAGIVVFV